MREVSPPAAVAFLFFFCVAVVDYLTPKAFRSSPLSRVAAFI
jgi:hypothetical protein